MFGRQLVLVRGIPTVVGIECQPRLGCWSSGLRTWLSPVAPGFLQVLTSLPTREDEFRSRARGFIGRWTVLQAAGGSIEIGSRTNIGDQCSLYGQGGLILGDDVVLASGCRIMTADKRLVGRDRLIRDYPQTSAATVIESDVWLGANVCVLAGVRIGRGSAVGAGAVVNRDLPAFSVAAGVPARVIRER